MWDVARGASEASEAVSEQLVKATSQGASEASEAGAVAGIESQSAPEQAPLEDNGLVWIPGCAIRRPVEIEVDDDTWRNAVASGLADEPHIQNALFLFGPGCTVVESGVPR